MQILSNETWEIFDFNMVLPMENPTKISLNYKCCIIMLNIYPNHYNTVVTFSAFYLLVFGQAYLEPGPQGVPNRQQ